jgi:hypothetical protein
MGLLDLRGVRHLAEIDLRKVVGARGASSADGIRSVAASPPPASDLFACRLFSDGLLAAFAEPMVSDRDFTRLPSQNASNSPSNLSQSDFRAENRCFNAERSRPALSI